MAEYQFVMKGLAKVVPPNKELLREIWLSFLPGAKIGVIGPNGAGKSTLFRMIQGVEQPDSGEIVIGQTAKLAFVDQSRDSLDGSKTVCEDVSGGLDNITVGKVGMASRAYLGRFNFKGNDQQKRVADLSGGERGRLPRDRRRHLAPREPERREQRQVASPAPDRGHQEPGRPERGERGRRRLHHRPGRRTAPRRAAPGKAQPATRQG